MKLSHKRTGLTSKTHVLDRKLSVRGTFQISVRHSETGFDVFTCHHPSLAGRNNHEITYYWDEKKGIFGTVWRNGNIGITIPATQIFLAGEYWFEVLPTGYLWPLDHFTGQRKPGQYRMQELESGEIRKGPDFLNDNSEFMRVSPRLKGKKICFVGEYYHRLGHKRHGRFYYGHKVVPHRVVRPFRTRVSASNK